LFQQQKREKQKGGMRIITCRKLKCEMFTRFQIPHNLQCFH